MTNAWNFREKYWELAKLENDIFLVFGYWVIQKIFLFANENQLGFHMKYHLFLQYGFFLQNFEKYFIQTNMHSSYKYNNQFDL